MRGARGDDGTWWDVYEAPVYADTERTCLIFESPAVVRRVHHFPADWRELPESRLLELMRGT